MHYSKLATVLNRQQKSRQFKAFSSCEIITINHSQPQEFYIFSLVDITKHRLSLDRIEQSAFNILKPNNR